MASRVQGRRGRPQGTGQAPPIFDKQAFVEVVGIAAAAIAQASITGSQRGPSNLQKFRTQHPPTFTGGGDPMVVDHWFIQIELAVFQLESEAQIWWKWARTSRDLRGAVVCEFSPRD